MHFGRFPLNQNLRNLQTVAIGTVFSRKISQTSENFSEMRTIQPKILDIREQSWMRKENFPEIIFENLGIHRENAVSFGTGSCRNFKPDVLIEWNGAHAKVTKFVTNCAPFARARESSTKKVSQVKFSFRRYGQWSHDSTWLTTGSESFALTYLLSWYQFYTNFHQI